MKSQGDASRDAERLFNAVNGDPLARLSVEMLIASKAAPTERNQRWAKNVLGAVHDFMNASGLDNDATAPIAHMIAAFTDAECGTLGPMLTVAAKRGGQSEAYNIAGPKAAAALFVEIVAEREHLQMKTAPARAAAVINSSPTWARIGMNDVMPGTLIEWRKAVRGKAKGSVAHSVYHSLKAKNAALARPGESLEQLFEALITLIL